MPQPNVTLTVEPLDARTAIIHIAGEVTGFAEAALMEAYNSATEGGASVVMLDFAPLEYMNSSGIGLLVTLLIRAQRAGHSLIAYGLNEHYQHVFELTRLNEAIQCFDTRDDALQAMGA